MRNTKSIGMIVGIFILLTILALPAPAGMSEAAKAAAGVALLMTIWWITEAIPIYATAFVPMALYPLLIIHCATRCIEDDSYRLVV